MEKNKPHSPYKVKDNVIARYLRKIGYELVPDKGDDATNSYKEYYKNFQNSKLKK